MKKIFLLITVLSINAFAAKEEGVCYLSLNSVSSGRIEKRISLKGSVVGDPSFPNMAREKITKLSTGESLILTVGRMGGGYATVLASPVDPLIYPPKTPTFRLVTRNPSHGLKGTQKVLFTSYDNGSDPEVTKIDLKCFLYQ